MDLGLSEQQQLLKNAAREFLEAECPTSLVREIEGGGKGYSEALWMKMAGLGWLGLALPTEHGGSGGDATDLVVLAEEMGRALVPGPFLISSVLCGQTLARRGSPIQKETLLGMICRGDLIAAMAGALPGHGSVTAMKADGCSVLNGTVGFVPYAGAAGCFVVVPTLDSGDQGVPMVVDASSPGIASTSMESVSAHRQCEIRFRDVKVWESAYLTGGAGLSEALDWATIAQCGEMVGRAEKVLEMVVDYSRSRVQFGRPIGSFQAVQHRCADLRVAVDGARFLTYQAAWRLSRRMPAGDGVSMAKAYCGSLSRRATEAGHSIFAGIAFAVEHDMHLYTARSKISEANLGDTDVHLVRIGEHLAP